MSTKPTVGERIDEISLSARDCLPDELVINASQAIELITSLTTSHEAEMQAFATEIQNLPRSRIAISWNTEKEEILHNVDAEKLDEIISRYLPQDPLPTTNNQEA